ncbi:hypothetical protein [Thiobacillus sp.]|uniref:hypothetical protein n=1 Tax=Thiobacillus sp. TaxID=924 RepID=UPI0011D6EAD2|nr:hypothetical protein [Thiobacillus sp.]TXH77077.1 MAG: hypothetical protein E6Q82_00820 [Thiobacillus sp.]
MSVKQMISGVQIKFAICNAGDYPLESRPELLAGAMRVISAWSVLESHLHRVFVALLKGEPAQGVAMFLTLESANAQRSVLMAAAQSALLSEDVELLQAILEIYKRKATARNRIAHHLWGYTDLIADGVLLMDPRDYLVWQSDAGGELPVDQIFVYKNNDFVDMINSIERLSAIFHDFYFMIGPHIHRHDELHQKLSSLPEIGSALNRLRKRH